MTKETIEEFRVKDNMTASERERLRECEVAFEIGLRQKYGNRLSAIMVTDLISQLSRDPSVYAYTVTGRKTEIDPDDREAFVRIAEKKVQASDLARRNLAFSDSMLRKQLEIECVQQWSPEDRISFFRDDSYQRRVSEYVAQRMDEM